MFIYTNIFWMVLKMKMKNRDYSNFPEFGHFKYLNKKST